MKGLHGMLSAISTLIQTLPGTIPTKSLVNFLVIMKMTVNSYYVITEIRNYAICLTRIISLNLYNSPMLYRLLFPLQR